MGYLEGSEGYMGAVGPGTGVVGVQCYYCSISREEYCGNESAKGFVLLGLLLLTTPLILVPLVWVAILD